MNYILKDLLYSNTYKKMKKNPDTISGLVCVAKSALISAINQEENKPILLITYNELQLQRILKDLKFYNDNSNILYFPKREISTYNYDAESNEIENIRIDVLNSIYKNKADIVVTTIEAIMQNMISKKGLYKNVIKLKQNQEVKLEQINKNLVNLGYERCELVEARGQFSIRGDIVDVSLNEKEGIRIELWGDEIDSIRKFNLQSQRSTDNLKNVEIYPATEKVLDDSIENICERIKEINVDGANTDIENIREGDYKNKIDKYFNEFYKEQNSLLDYLEGFEIFIDEPEKVKQRIKNIKEDTKNFILELIEKNRSVPEALENYENFKLKVSNAINLKETDSKENCFHLKEINILNGDLNRLSSDTKNEIKQNKKIIVLAGAKENAIKISKLIEGSTVVENLNDISLKEKQIVITSGNLSSGFQNEETNLIVYSSDEFYNNKKTKKKYSNNFKTSEKIVFADLKENDLVVHRTYGIGIFNGVKTIETDGIRKDYISIKYRGGDNLYVPTNNLDNVRKYIGGEENVKLNKLGTKEWKETKARVKGNLKTVAKELIDLYAKREHSKGFAFSKDTPWQNEFEEKFPYQETDDQLRCIDEVKKDMELQKPMDRLLCGDVGYGKTEVAIRAAFKAIMDGKQVAYLAPTTILANQQYQEFKERMKDYPIEVDLLNRFRTQKQQKDTVKKLKIGEVDVVIGTHRLLSKDVEFKNLGLLIIDEEHRFGVKAKEKIKQYKASVDVLTMTATPIPRTLQMSIVGIRDMSVIYEPPQNRKPIQTYVLEYDKEIIREAITKELERKGQVFYIFNNVERIASKALEIEKLVPEAKVDFAHGQMSGSQIEDIMQDFIDGKTNVLVCTTILESGIDIPNANTIIVENSDRFGLAQLYQIRGRVGRSNRQAYAYITYRKDKLISEEANQRLKAIKEFTEFGSGFKIATRDLQIRGAGSLFGEIQSGHMEQVGYDMYNRLLDEVIKETRGEKVENENEDEEIIIDINLSAFIPEKYIEDSSQKIEIYQDIAECKNEQDIKNVIDEIEDRYGNIPKEVENLLEIARVKNLARKKHIIKIQQKPMGIMFTFTQFDTSKVDELIKKYENRIRFSAIGSPYVTVKVGENQVEEIKQFLNDI